MGSGDIAFLHPDAMMSWQRTSGESKSAKKERVRCTCFIGSDSFEMASAKTEAVQKDLVAFEAIGKSTDYPK